MKAKKDFIIIGLISLLLAPLAMAAENHNFTETKQIIGQKTPCSELTAEQLETIGDYYMEQLHPGEQHEYMDTMMGGEGSESLKQMHIAMAYRFYCSGLSNEATQYYGMIGSKYGMMGGMMGSVFGGMMGSSFGGMMGPSTMYNSYGLWGGLNQILFTVALIVAIGFFALKISKEIKTK